MEDAVQEKLDRVEDAATFFEFLEALLADLPQKDVVLNTSSTDRYYNGVSGCMNQDLWSFIEAASAGGQSVGFGKDAQTPAQAWKAAADILYCGKVYE